MMANDDRNLDLALRALADTRPTSRDEEEAWTKSVMGRVETASRKGP